MLSDGVVYADLGADYFSRLDTGKTIQCLLKRLADLGYHPQPAASSQALLTNPSEIFSTSTLSA
jgi:hypothetical protein